MVNEDGTKLALIYFEEREVSVLLKYEFFQIKLQEVWLEMNDEYTHVWRATG